MSKLTPIEEMTREEMEQEWAEAYPSQVGLVTGWSDQTLANKLTALRNVSVEDDDDTDVPTTVSGIISLFGGIKEKLFSKEVGNSILEAHKKGGIDVAAEALAFTIVTGIMAGVFKLAPKKIQPFLSSKFAYIVQFAFFSFCIVVVASAVQIAHPKFVYLRDAAARQSYRQIIAVTKLVERISKLVPGLDFFFGSDPKAEAMIAAEKSKGA